VFGGRNSLDAMPIPGLRAENGRGSGRRDTWRGLGALAAQRALTSRRRCTASVALAVSSNPAWPTP
jgi:hypothetical protein